MMNQLNARIQNAETRLDKKLLVLAELTTRSKHSGDVENGYLLDLRFRDGF